jgi:DNA-binding CsgD family transcriptional regulator
MLDTDHEALAASLQSISDPDSFAEIFGRLAAAAGYRAWAMAEMTRTGEGGLAFEILASSHGGQVRRSYACRSAEKSFRLIERTWRAKAALKWRVVTDGSQPEESCIQLHAHLGGRPGEELLVVPLHSDDPSRRNFGFALPAGADCRQDDVSDGMRLYAAFFARRKVEANLPRRLDLSRREVAVLQNCAMGMKSEAIAEAEGISPHTVKDYLERVRIKLEARTIAHAVALAMRAKLIR